jgi:hypothetical protein
MEFLILPLVVIRISLSLISASSLGFSIFSYLSMLQQSNQIDKHCNSMLHWQIGTYGKAKRNDWGYSWDGTNLSVDRSRSLACSVACAFGATLVFAILPPAKPKQNSRMHGQNTGKMLFVSMARELQQGARM